MQDKTNLIRKRKRTFCKFKKTNNNYFWIKYKLHRNKVNAAKRLSRKQYFDKLDHLLSSENCDPKIFWKTSKRLLNIGRSSSNIPVLTMNHEMTETDQQKAEMLNTYFSSQTKVNGTNKQLPTLKLVQHVLESITITTQDVLDVLKHLNVSKACGSDLISPKVLRECADDLAYPYSIVFNRSLAQGHFLEERQTISNS